MIGTAGIEVSPGKFEYYAVRSVIEERINQPAILSEYNILSKLHVINAKEISQDIMRVIDKIEKTEKKEARIKDNLHFPTRRSLQERSSPALFFDAFSQENRTPFQ